VIAGKREAAGKRDDGQRDHYPSLSQFASLVGRDLT
jgi:hypothetical protein